MNNEGVQHLLHPDHDEGPIEMIVTYTLLDAEAILMNSNKFLSQKVLGKLVCVREDASFDVFDTIDLGANRNNFPMLDASGGTDSPQPQ